MKLSRSALIAISLLVPATAGLAGLAQAAQPSSHRYVTLPSDKSGAIWVLDTTTSLRWQQEPGGTYVEGNGAICNGGVECGASANDYCAALGDGARVPEVKELISLIDFNILGAASELNAPNGPFSNVQPRHYISATPFAIGVWLVDFKYGTVETPFSELGRAWCVR
jgi:hypothetical protein